MFVLISFLSRTFNFFFYSQQTDISFKVMKSSVQVLRFDNLLSVLCVPSSVFIQWHLYAYQLKYVQFKSCTDRIWVLQYLKSSYSIHKLLFQWTHWMLKKEKKNYLLAVWTDIIHPHDSEAMCICNDLFKCLFQRTVWLWNSHLNLFKFCSLCVKCKECFMCSKLGKRFECFQKALM